MLMSGTYKTLKTDRGPPYLLMAYPQTSNFVRISYISTWFAQTDEEVNRNPILQSATAMPMAPLVSRQSYHAFFWLVPCLPECSQPPNPNVHVVNQEPTLVCSWYLWYFTKVDLSIRIMDGDCCDFAFVFCNCRDPRLSCLTFWFKGQELEMIFV